MKKLKSIKLLANCLSILSLLPCVLNNNSIVMNNIPVKCVKFNKATLNYEDIDDSYSDEDELKYSDDKLPIIESKTAPISRFKRI